jgi:TonB family protein
VQVRQGNTIVQAVDGVAGMAWESRVGGPDLGEDAVDLGNASTIGSGGGGGTGSGYGHGSGSGFHGRGKRVPMVRYAVSRVSGALGAAIIQRIVRAHINELRGCYNQALVRDPELEGRVRTTFVIAPNGSVSSSVIAESELDARANACIAKAIRRWSFPAVEGMGTTVVNYPFVFAPSEDGSEDDARVEVLHNATH